jgi:hypothetical protein
MDSHSPARKVPKNYLTLFSLAEAKFLRIGHEIVTPVAQSLLVN